MFGDGVTKATCLWLKNLQPLMPTNIVEGREPAIWMPRDANGRYLQWNDPETAKQRSRTFPGIATAMADQWSRPLTLELIA
jgi:hypothetical protein